MGISKEILDTLKEVLERDRDWNRQLGTLIENGRRNEQRIGELTTDLREAIKEQNNRIAANEKRLSDLEVFTKSKAFDAIMAHLTQTGALPGVLRQPIPTPALDAEHPPALPTGPAAPMPQTPGSDKDAPADTMEEPDREPGRTEADLREHNPDSEAPPPIGDGEAAEG